MGIDQRRRFRWRVAVESESSRGSDRNHVLIGGCGAAKLLYVGRLAKPESLQRRVDTTQQSRKHPAGTDFEKSVNALRGQITDGLFPTHGIRNLLDEAPAGRCAGAHLLSLPVVDEWPVEIVKRS